MRPVFMSGAAKQMLAALLHIIDGSSERVGKIASFIVLIAAGVVFYEVVVRYGFNRPTLWAGEAAGFVYGVHFLLGGAYTLRLGAHVNMDLIYSRFSPRGKAIADLVTSTLFFLFCGLLLWKGGEMAWTSVRILECSDTVWGPPIYPIKVIIPIAAFLMLLQGLAGFIRNLLFAVTGRKIEVKVEPSTLEERV